MAGELDIAAEVQETIPETRTTKARPLQITADYEHENLRINYVVGHMVDGEFCRIGGIRHHSFGNETNEDGTPGTQWWTLYTNQAVEGQHVALIAATMRNQGLI